MFRILILFTSIIAVVSHCVCDDSPGRRHLAADHRVVSELVILPAKVKGLDYIRPLGIPRRDNTRLSSLLNNGETDPDCRSDQVHLGLGSDLASVLVSFATYSLNESSTVYFSENEEDLLSTAGSTKSLRVASGSFRSYSEQLYIITPAVSPYMVLYCIVYQLFLFLL